MQTGGLPWAYRKVEYLESNGSPYIVLNEKATYNCEIALDCYAVRYSGNRFFMGSRKAPNAGCIAIIGIQPMVVYQFGDMPMSIYAKDITLNSRHVIVANNIGCFVDDVKMYSYNGTSNVSESDNNIFLFASSQGSNEVEYHAPPGFRVYSAYVKKSGVYTVKLIPCVRKSDNKPGMYDTVTKTFYTNAGNGEFAVPI